MISCLSLGLRCRTGTGRCAHSHSLAGIGTGAAAVNAIAFAGWRCKNGRLRELSGYRPKTGTKHRYIKRLTAHNRTPSTTGPSVNPPCPTPRPPRPRIRPRRRSTLNNFSSLPRPSRLCRTLNSMLSCTKTLKRPSPILLGSVRIHHSSLSPSFSSLPFPP